MRDAVQVNQNERGQAQEQQVQPQEQQEQQRGFQFSFIHLIIIFVVVQVASSLFHTTSREDPNLIHNVFAPDDYFDMSVKIVKDSKILFSWEEKELQYNYDDKNYLNKTFSFSKEQVFSKPYPKVIVSVKNLNRTGFIVNTGELVVIEEKKTKAQLQSLVSSVNDDIPSVSKKNVTKGEKAPHLRQRFYVQFIHDSNSYHPSQIPPQLKNVLNINFREKIYEPSLDLAQFWVRRKDLVYEGQLEEDRHNEELELVKSKKESSSIDLKQNISDSQIVEKHHNDVEYLPLEYNSTVVFYPYWQIKFMLILQIEETFDKQTEWGLHDHSSTDQFKEILGDNNPYYLAVTFIVSMLHSVFELLAVKNDISYWNNLKNYQGLSLRSLYTSLLFEGIILLYLFDSEETSWLILLSSSIELVVTIWKIFRTAKCQMRKDKKFPYLEVDHNGSYVRTTEEFDKTATKYLYMLFFPMLIGYTIYSLLYEEHKGWYSFIITTLVGFIYLFGFINMTPQLYINYKLKSVEHLPWRTMIYKFLNTIVDDLFAFVISMPWLKRLSCFRDDLIFVVYIYQRHIYKIDTRRTEHGFKKDELVPVNQPADSHQKTE